MSDIENGMKILGIIPARGGSSRIHRKNLRTIGGRSLVQRAIYCALASKCFSVVAVSSDDTEILDEAAKTPGVVPLYRPARIASETSLAIEYVQQAWNCLGYFDAFAIVQPTSPFTLPSDIDEALTLLNTPFVDSVVSVMEVEHDLHPAKFKAIENNRLVPYLEPEAGRMASHQLPKVYVRNGAIYASRSHVIANGQLLGPHCVPYIMPRNRSLDINDETDLAFAEFMEARNVDG